jgi:hypothetical protein
MIHKQITLPEQLNQEIQQRVKQLKQPEEQVITDLLEKGLQTTKLWKNAGEALSSLSALGIQGPKDLSINHDKYLYEDE